jgi:hypothetical protein
MLPVVRPETFGAHFQKFTHELERGEGRIAPAGVLLTSMVDNAELAAEIVVMTASVDNQRGRGLALAIAGAMYQALKAQAESDVLESE